MHQISNDCTLEADRSRGRSTKLIILLISMFYLHIEATMMLEDYRQKKLNWDNTEIGSRVVYKNCGKGKIAWPDLHRCSKVSRNEIIETLKSILDLLRKGSTENADIKPLSVRSNDYLVDSKETKVVVSCKNSQPVP
ncbi:hypothetical protein Tco_1161632, partial [Tanacetum coccineum]